MKKYIAMLMALMMLLSLTACGGHSAPEEPAAPAPTTEIVNENGLTPREQFEQTQQLMEELIAFCTSGQIA